MPIRPNSVYYKNNGEWNIIWERNVVPDLFNYEIEYVGYLTSGGWSGSSKYDGLGVGLETATYISPECGAGNTGDVIAKISVSDNNFSKNSIADSLNFEHLSSYFKDDQNERKWSFNASSNLWQNRQNYRIGCVMGNTYLLNTASSTKFIFRAYDISNNNLIGEVTLPAYDTLGDHVCAPDLSGGYLHRCHYGVNLDGNYVNGMTNTSNGHYIGM